MPHAETLAKSSLSVKRRIRESRVAHQAEPAGKCQTTLSGPKDHQSDLWVGRCLDFGLVTSGKSDDAAWTNLKSVVKLHIEHCFTNDQPGLLRHRATDEDFANFDTDIQKQHFRSEKIYLNLVAPKEPDAQSFWIHGVELDETPSQVHAVR